MVVKNKQNNNKSKKNKLIQDKKYEQTIFTRTIENNQSEDLAENSQC